MHIVIIDEDGEITGTPGEILEKWKDFQNYLMQRTDGSTNYYRDVLYNQFKLYLQHGSSM